MIVIIPCAGNGKGVQGHMPSQWSEVPKLLHPYQSRILLGHIYDSLIPFVNAEDKARFIFVIKPADEVAMVAAIQSHISSANSGCITKQAEPLGFGHAVLQARQAIQEWKAESMPVLIHASDVVLHQMPLERDVSWMAVRQLCPAEGDPMLKGIVQTRDGAVSTVFEQADLSWLGVAYIRDATLLFDCLQELVDTGYRTNAEYQMTDALRLMVERGHRIEAKPTLWAYRERSHRGGVHGT